MNPPKPAKSPRRPPANFFDDVAQLIEEARRHVARAANTAMCVTYYEIGRMIVEQEQGGKTRAKYGDKLIRELATHLTTRFGRGFSPTNLKSFKTFYLEYSYEIGQMSSDLFAPKKTNLQLALAKPAEPANSATPPSIRQMTSAELGSQISPRQRHQLHYPASFFTLGWSHYQILMRIQNRAERRFYPCNPRLIKNTFSTFPNMTATTTTPQLPQWWLDT